MTCLQLFESKIENGRTLLIFYIGRADLIYNEGLLIRWLEEYFNEKRIQVAFLLLAIITAVATAIWAVFLYLNSPAGVPPDAANSPGRDAPVVSEGDCNIGEGASFESHGDNTTNIICGDARNVESGKN